MQVWVSREVPEAMRSPAPDVSDAAREAWTNFAEKRAEELRWVGNGDGSNTGSSTGDYCYYAGPSIGKLISRRQDSGKGTPSSYHSSLAGLRLVAWGRV